MCRTFAAIVTAECNGYFGNIVLIKKSAKTHRRGSVYVDGELLRQTRQQVQLTQEQAGEKSGYSDRLIRKLESGGPVSAQTLHDVVETYREISPRSLAERAATFVLPRQHSENERLVLEWFRRAYNERDIAVISDLLHSTARAGRAPGALSICRRLETLWAAFHPLEVQVEQMFADGDWVIALWKAKMKQVRNFFGLVPTDRRMIIRGSSRFHLRQGRIVEVHDHVDVGDLVRSAGHSPRP